MKTNSMLATAAISMLATSILTQTAVAGPYPVVSPEISEVLQNGANTFTLYSQWTQESATEWIYLYSTSPTYPAGGTPGETPVPISSLSVLFGASLPGAVLASPPAADSVGSTPSASASEISFPLMSGYPPVGSTGFTMGFGSSDAPGLGIAEALDVDGGSWGAASGNVYVPNGAASAPDGGTTMALLGGTLLGLGALRRKIGC